MRIDVGVERVISNPASLSEPYIKAIPEAATTVVKSDSMDAAFDCLDAVDYQLGIEMLATQLFRRQVREANIVKVAFD